MIFVFAELIYLLFIISTFYLDQIGKDIRRKKQVIVKDKRK